MFPQLAPVSPVGSPAQATSENAGGRFARHDAPVQTDSKTPTETARAVDPPKALNRPDATSTPERRNLNPPDPRAPAGPPPAFEASILDRAREEALHPPRPDPLREAFVAPEEIAAQDEPEIVERPKPRPENPDAAAFGEDASVGIDLVERRTGPTDRRARTEDDGAGTTRDRRASYDVPPSAGARAEREVATIRSFEAPADHGTVDVSR